MMTLGIRVCSLTPFSIYDCFCFSVLYMFCILISTMFVSANYQRDRRDRRNYQRDQVTTISSYLPTEAPQKVKVNLQYRNVSNQSTMARESIEKLDAMERRISTHK
jgi:uncharacterized protein YlxW (UPF0749 family)